MKINAIICTKIRFQSQGVDSEVLQWSLLIVVYLKYQN